jgi:prolyl-tRNA synthetase
VPDRTGGERDFTTAAGPGVARAASRAGGEGGGPSLGRRLTEWDLKGVPVRVEIGPRDLKEGVVTIVRHDNGEKAAVPVDGVATAAREALEAAQRALAEESRARTEAHTRDVATVGEAIEAAAEGFARLPWDACGVEGER